MIESLSFLSMSVSPSPVLQITSKSHIPSPDYCVARHCKIVTPDPHLHILGPLQPLLSSLQRYATSCRQLLLLLLTAVGCFHKVLHLRL